LASSKNKLRLAALAALLVLVAVLVFLRLHRDSSTEVPSEPVMPTTSPALPPAPPLPPPSKGLPAKPAPQVYLRIDGIKLLRPAGEHVRVHLRADVNSAYYDYPSPPGDAGIGWIEVEPHMKAEHFPIARAFMYELDVELQIRGRDRLIGKAETLALTTPSGALSDKLPFSEDYKLYLTGHGMKAAEPSAIVSYTITETP
jgi:hypothetical protein